MRTCAATGATLRRWPGVMFNKDVVVPGRMRRRIENPRVLLLDCPLEYKKGENQTNVELTKEEDWCGRGQLAPPGLEPRPAAQRHLGLHSHAKGGGQARMWHGASGVAGTRG
jgi:hypothetical protein